MPYPPGGSTAERERALDHRALARATAALHRERAAGQPRWPRTPFGRAWVRVRYGRRWSLAARVVLAAVVPLLDWRIAPHSAAVPVLAVGP